MKYYDQKQLNEEGAYLVYVSRDIEAIMAGKDWHAVVGGRSWQPAGRISIHAQDTEREQEMG